MAKQTRQGRRHRNIHWSDEHEAALLAYYEKLKAAGVTLERNGTPNASEIVLQALQDALKVRR